MFKKLFKWLFLLNIKPAFTCHHEQKAVDLNVFFFKSNVRLDILSVIKFVVLLENINISEMFSHVCVY